MSDRRSFRVTVSLPRKDASDAVAAATTLAARPGVPSGHTDQVVGLTLLLGTAAAIARRLRGSPDLDLRSYWLDVCGIAFDNPIGEDAVDVEVVEGAPSTAAAADATGVPE